MLFWSSAIIVGAVIGVSMYYAFGFYKTPNVNGKPEYVYYHGMFGDVHAIRKYSLEYHACKVMNFVFTILFLIFLAPVFFMAYVLLLFVLGF